MRDLQQALRSLRRSPGFVAVAIVALGIGLGLTTTMVGIVEAVLRPYVPFRDPDRLFSVFWLYNMRRPPLTSFEMHAAIRDETRSFELVAPVSVERATLETGPFPGDVTLATMPARLPADLGLVGRITGRSFTTADAVGDAILVSYGLARRVFGREAAAIGRSLLLGGQARTVVGVMPRGMNLPYGAEVWAAMTPEVQSGTSTTRRLGTVVRLKPAVSPEAATQELELMASRLTAVHQQRGAPFAIRLNPVVQRADRVREMQKLMLASSIAILLIACANLANLMLARGMAKRRELAVRMALGATRWSIAGQMFAEAVLITLAGAVVGVIAAKWGGDIMANRVPRSMEWLGFVEPRLSIRVFAITAALAGAGAILFGLLPSLKLARAVQLAEPLKDGGATTGRSHRRHSWLVIGQLAITLPLLMAGGGVLVVLLNTIRYEVSYAAPELLTGSVRIPTGRALTADDARRLDEEIIGAIRAVPGVIDVATRRSVTPPGLAVTAEIASDTPRVINRRSYPVVSPEYFRTLGMAITAGRHPQPGDAVVGGVVVLDQDAAAWLYPDQDPVGRMVKLGGPRANAPWVRVVGVAAPAVLQARRAGPAVSSGTLWAVLPPAAGGGSVGIWVRSRRADARLATTIVRVLRTQYPTTQVSLRPELESYQISLRGLLFMTQLFVALGLCGLVLGAVGLYGVVAYSVSQRLREFAVRVALGADPVKVRQLVLHDGAVMVLAGTALGGVPALGIASGLGPTAGPLVLVLCELLLVGAMIAACLVPARRAAQADPMSIIRAV